MTEESARKAVVAACERVGLDPTGSVLVRLGSNAVFRLKKATIVRIGRDVGGMRDAAKQVAVARWLETEGYPAARALKVAQPVDLGGHPVTYWESASDSERYAPLSQVGTLLRCLHALSPPGSLQLDETRPFAKLDKQAGALGNLHPDDAAFLRDRIDFLRESYQSVDFALSPGVIHGDANVGNVILDREGNPVLIDLDSFSIGPREWDLVQTALFYERFGWHTEEEYRSFVEAYGFDIMEWPGYPVLADYREISMTMWLCGKAGSDERAAAEVRKRVETLRTGGSRREWAPF
ncbi:phosphotransferase family protein [Prauserella muralis]|nr:aminoglycoside phosphotransferase family protein [Prauserella muralis]TWE14615.1 Ser/Thr protein kinase RdoA (MazF antagonist) [Prauserella muralis]